MAKALIDDQASDAQPNPPPLVDTYSGDVEASHASYHDCYGFPSYISSDGQRAIATLERLFNPAPPALISEVAP